MEDRLWTHLYESELYYIRADMSMKSENHNNKRNMSERQTKEKHEKKEGNKRLLVEL